MTTIYRIRAFDTFGNSHATNRDETFNTSEEAEKYVIEKSLVFTEMAIYSFKLPEEEKKIFIVDFVLKIIHF